MNKAPFHLRLASSKDAAALLEIYAPFVLEDATSFEIQLPSVEEFSRRISEISEKFPWIVIERDSQIVGYAYASAYRSRCAYEWSTESSVYVRKGFERQGLGKILYESLFETLKTQGVVNVFAGITLPNESSVKFHESMGFKNVGIFKDVGFKLNQWRDVGWWELQFPKPPQAPQGLTPVGKLPPI